MRSSYRRCIRGKVRSCRRNSWYLAESATSLLLDDRWFGTMLYWPPALAMFWSHALIRWLRCLWPTSNFICRQKYRLPLWNRRRCYEKTDNAYEFPAGKLKWLYLFTPSFFTFSDSLFSFDLLCLLRSSVWMERGGGFGAVASRLL